MALVAARRLLVKLPKTSLPALQAVRHCSFYKKPFLDTLEKKVELEGPEAPKWYDDDEEFWKIAEDYVKDQPDVSVPWNALFGMVAFPLSCYLFYKVFLEEGTAGKFEWLSDIINQDKYLMWGLDPEFITEEDQAIIDARKEHAKTVPLATRLFELLFQFHPYTLMHWEVDWAKRHSRSVMAFHENRVRYLDEATQLKTQNFNILESAEVYRVSPNFVDATMVHYKDI